MAEPWIHLCLSWETRGKQISIWSYFCVSVKYSMIWSCILRSIIIEITGKWNWSVIWGFLSLICKGSDKTNWKLSANNSKLRSKKEYLKYLSLGNLEATFLCQTFNLKSLVESSLLKLFYTFISFFKIFGSALCFFLWILGKEYFF